MSNDPDFADVSVVIPAFNAGTDLEKCLTAIRASCGNGLEVIVVDDASTQAGADELAQRFRASFIRLEENSGPAVARNRGVAAASGSLIMFVDADVVVHDRAIAKAVNALRADESLGAVFGSYDETPADPAFLSQYRNLYHRWVHQVGDSDASTFWTGCGAVRRSAFDAAGGFNPALSRSGMEDIDLGYRISDAGFRIRLIKDMECQHLKAWTLRGLIKTDVFHRGVPWMLILLANPNRGKDLSINHRARISTLAAGLLPGLLILGLIWIPALCLALLALGLIVGLQWGFYRYTGRLKGGWFAARVIPAQAIFFMCCAASIPIALVLHHTGRGLDQS